MLEPIGYDDTRVVGGSIFHARGFEEQRGYIGGYTSRFSNTEMIRKSRRARLARYVPRALFVCEQS